MKLNIGTDKIRGWYMRPLKWIIPSCLLMGSWFAAQHAEGNSFVGVWWAVISSASMMGSLVTGVALVTEALEEIDKRKYR
jgi:hypothetical protein